MSDAVRRLATQGSLTDADRGDIVALMKTSAGLSDAQQRKAVRVALGALPDVAVDFLGHSGAKVPHSAPRACTSAGAAGLISGLCSEEEDQLRKRRPDRAGPQNF